MNEHAGLWPHLTSSVSRAETALEHALESVVDAQARLDKERARIGLPPAERAWLFAREIDGIVEQRLKAKAEADAEEKPRYVYGDAVRFTYGKEAAAEAEQATKSAPYRDDPTAFHNVSPAFVVMLFDTVFADLDAGAQPDRFLKSLKTYRGWFVPEDSVVLKDPCYGAMDRVMAGLLAKLPDADAARAARAAKAAEDERAQQAIAAGEILPLRRRPDLETRPL
ncbi:MAG: hypothetical protein ACLPKT_14855 [Methylocella sp.]